MNYNKLICSTLTIIFLSVNSFAQNTDSKFYKLNEKQFKEISIRTEITIKQAQLLPYKRSAKIDSIFINKENKILNIYFSRNFS